MKTKKTKIKVTDIKQTCSACPSQWEGMTDKGKMIYVRYRWGFLSVRVSPKITTNVDNAVDGKQVFGCQYGDGLDGSMNYKQLTKLTKGDIIWPGKCKDEPGPLYLISFGKEKKFKQRSKNSKTK